MEKNNTAVIFSAFSPNGQIYRDVPQYLAELKRLSDFLIYISDNDSITDDSLKSVREYADDIIISKHNKYDFGSYQLGFNYLINNKDLYQSINKIFFCNDSVIFCGNPLDNFFEKSDGKDFYGLTCNTYGFSKVVVNGIVRYPWRRLPHIQSYIFSVSKQIADNQIFRDFFNNIQEEKTKEDIIAKYEIGLSQLMLKMGFELESYYPRIEAKTDPCGYFLSKDSSYKENRLFLKRKPLPPVHLEQDICVG